MEGRLMKLLIDDDAGPSHVIQVVLRL
jgi:hypothetical protein